MTPSEARAALPARLRRTIRDRGVKQRDLAATLGVRDSTVSEWCRGVRFPMLGMAPLIAEHLDAPGVADLIVAGHTLSCVVCARPVVHAQRTRTSRYCSPACKSTMHDRVRRASRIDAGTVERRRLTMYQEAVDAFCRSCEPEGLCRTPDCSLRPVSPLPLAKVRAA